MTIMIMVMNGRYIVMIIQTNCFGCHYNHNARKCGSLHTEANDIFKTMPFQNH